MTAQKAQLESLIQEIDEILEKTAPRLPWLMPSDAVKQRQVLEQTRHYLLSLQDEPQETQFPATAEINLPPKQISEPVSKPEAAPPRLAIRVTDSIVQSEPAAANSDRLADARRAAAQSDRLVAAQSDRLPATQPAPDPAQTAVVESAQQALQAMVQEMNYLRSNLLQPMRSDMDVLRQQRETLQQEIRQLEAQRQQYGLPQQNQLLMEFLQAAFRQMQENLSAQVTQMIALQSSQTALPEAPSFAIGSSDLMALSPAQRLEQMQRVQTQSDQLLLKLDSSLRVIFSSLQQNVQTYQDSLEQGLSRMHNLGQQGEAMFAALVTRLAEQLGREASTFLQSSIEPVVWESAAGQSSTGQASAKPSEPQAPPQTEGDIARLLDELSELDAVQPPPTVSPFAADARSSNSESLNSLDLLDLELQQLDLDAFSPGPFAIVDEDPTLFQEEPLDAFLSTDLTVLQDEPEILPLDREQPNFTSAATSHPPVDDQDAVLDLLNQVSFEIQGNSAEAIAEVPLEASAAEAVDSSRYSFGVEETAKTSTLVDSPDSLYDDSFYQSLFGEGAAQPPAVDLLTEEIFEPEAAFTAEPAAENPIDRFDAQQQAVAQSDRPDAADSSGPDRLAAEDLFSSFLEPPDSSSENLAAPGTEELTIVEAADLPQTVENVLLPPIELQPLMPPNPIAQPIAQPTAQSTEKFAEIDRAAPALPAESESAPAGNPPDAAIETINSLLDLIPFESSAGVLPEALSAASANPAEPPSGLTDLFSEPEFELAQPGEDLLTEEPFKQDALLNLSLPAETLDQLAQDLASLESEAAPFDQRFAIADAADWMLPDAPPAAPEPPDDVYLSPEAAGQSNEPIENLLPNSPLPADRSEAQPEAWDLFNDPASPQTAAPAEVGFTLEGLESLFDTVPAIESGAIDAATEQSLQSLDELSRAAIEPSDLPASTDPDAGASEEDEKKKS